MKQVVPAVCQAVLTAVGGDEASDGAQKDGGDGGKLDHFRKVRWNTP